MIWKVVASSMGALDRLRSRVNSEERETAALLSHQAISVVAVVIYFATPN